MGGKRADTDGRDMPGSRPKGRAARYVDAGIDALFWLSMTAAALLMLHVVADVAGRLLLSRPLAGTTEIVAAYYMVALAYLPLGRLTRGREHIVVETFTRQLAPARRAGLDRCADGLTLLYVAALLWQTGLKAADETAAGEVWEAGYGYLPVWPSRWLLPAAGLLTGAYLTLKLLRAITRPADDGRPPQ